jgi:maltoporin
MWIRLCWWCPLFLTSVGQAVTGEFFDYKGYFRTGVGSNFDGGGRQCFNQQGVPGNEFRLGNECTDYGEMYFDAHVVKPKEDNKTFFDAWVSFSFNPPGYTQYETVDLTGNPVLSLIEAYIVGGGFGGSPLSYWVGKRFYREPEMYMDDFFYFADSSGSGGGVENIPLLNGKMAFAFLTETGATVLNGTRSRILMLDVRLFRVPISPVDDLNFWTTVSISSGGASPSSGTHYDNATGNALGVKYHRMLTGGDNNLALVWGRGLSQGLNLGGMFGGNSAPISGVSTQNSSWRVRAVEDLVVQLDSDWALEFGAVFEQWNAGGTSDNSTWVSIGTRPIYFVTEYLSLALEVGGSSVYPAGGNRASQYLRTTFATQLSPKIDFFARPVLRAYVTNTWGWGGGYGLQGEVWF